MGADKPHGHRAVFLDRDGVINRNVLNAATGEYESPLTAEQFEFLPGALDAMRTLQAAGFLLFLVSNQPNYAKAKASLETLQSIHDRLISGLDAAGVTFAAFYYCFHHPEGRVAGYSGRCLCRKPSPHFLLQASAEFGVDLRRSWMVGDRVTDVECGSQAGTRTILIRKGQKNAEAEVSPDEIVPDLLTAVPIILSGALADSQLVH
jgi:D-glycero-D-manno-heptose 1,7-bisphosphate phosphatase